MQTMELDNDLRGWIMCLVSALACVVGSSIICVDIPLRHFPGKRNFRIQDSSVFLACSLSLSFGVMLFSALYSMLPEAKVYLEKAGYNGRTAALFSTMCFIAGFLGIQAVSRFLHQFMPSHVVDCDHSHDEQALLEGQDGPCSHGSRRRSRSRSQHRRGSRRAHAHAPRPSQPPQREEPCEHTPLLGRPQSGHGHDGHEPESEHEHERANGLVDASNTTTTATRAGNNDDDDDDYDDGGGGGGGGGGHEPKFASVPTPTLPLINTGHAPPPPRAYSQTASTPVDPRRPSMVRVQRRVLSFVKDTKPNCDELGPCYGYSDPCGQECFKHVALRQPTPARASTIGLLRTTTTGPIYPGSAPDGREVMRRGKGGDRIAENDEGDDEGENDEVPSPKFRTSRAKSRDVVGGIRHDASCSSVSEETDGPPSHADNNIPHASSHPRPHFHHPHFRLHGSAHSHTHSHAHSSSHLAVHPTASSTFPPSPLAPDPTSSFPDPHHHHVPTNAFMSLGLQTSLAIALHKFPEGFITYATNHANPDLGFAVFMALFVHNISEGFAMALPLYMALGSRLRAMAWSALLGGLSQPLGAALAVAWFRLAGGGDGSGGDGGDTGHGHGGGGGGGGGSYLAPNEVVYACLFAGTAGIMVSVALQLFVESMSLNHNRNLCIFFGFIGMVLLGLSGALVSGDH